MLGREMGRGWGYNPPPATACQKSLAEFAAHRRQIKSNHFLSGHVPDRKYLSGCEVCAADCNPFVKKAVGLF